MTNSTPMLYQADPVTGEYIGSVFADSDPLVEGEWLIPAMAFTTAPPVVEPGYAAVHVKDSEHIWSFTPDLRGTVYRIDNGEEINWHKLGELPGDFTPLQRPDINHTWDGSSWALDEHAKNSHECEVERRWRNLEIENTKWLRERHRDESDLKLDTTLTDIQFGQLLAHLQLLRDWPQHPKFPVFEFRPKAPDWIIGQK
ncbi:hypothetical protein M2399_002799 [Pseudomonas sp. BIGb0450]|uniref:hypothetical protein n=1 Tax=unclassified Pseudomonas TaxID=196821 RepID=UPI002166FCBE|nr:MULTISPECIES: hypothetical protein [unclassified Pseudomonas]MCS3417397.1 hypothetical protein [Pseudomonas sp. BIGb0558]MCS3437358.1 hypothetical protein [Pseudomonas sp. BIGb0450]